MYKICRYLQVLGFEMQIETVVFIFNTYDSTIIAQQQQLTLSHHKIFFNSTFYFKLSNTYYTHVIMCKSKFYMITSLGENQQS